MQTSTPAECFDYSTCHLLRLSPRESARAAEAVLGRRVTPGEAQAGMDTARARIEAAESHTRHLDTVGNFERSQFAKGSATTMLYKLINNSALRDRAA